MPKPYERTHLLTFVKYWLWWDGIGNGKPDIHLQKWAHRNRADIAKPTDQMCETIRQLGYDTPSSMAQSLLWLRDEVGLSDYITEPAPGLLAASD